MYILWRITIVVGSLVVSRCSNKLDTYIILYYESGPYTVLKLL